MQTEIVDEIELRNNYNVHDYLKRLSVEELREINAKDRLPYAIGLFNVNGDLNVGICIRTAILMGAEKILVFGKKHYNKKSCVGANHYIEIDNVGGMNFDTKQINFNLYWETINKHNYFPVYIELHPNAQQLEISEDLISKIIKQYNKKPCFIFGSESYGIPNELLEKSNEIYYIPMLGVIRSLNISATCAMVCHTLMSNFGK